MSNLVPKGWGEYRQGDVADFSNGRAYKLTEWEKSGTPVIRLQNLTGSGKDYYYSNMELPERQYCEAGDLLYMWSATFGPHIWRGPKAIYHYHIWKITCNEKELTKSYLYHLLGFKTSEWLNQSNGMGILHITKGGMEDLNLLLPPLPEQQKIAKILTSVDEVIEKTQAQINKLKDLKTGMMQELLTKGVGVDGKPHTEFKDSPVGRIPKAWKVVSLSSVAERVGDGIHATPKYVDKSDYPFINGNNLKDGKIFVGSNTRFVSLKEYEKHRTELSDSTILMSINGTIGNLAYYLNEPVVLGKSAAYISLVEGVSKSFIYYVLGSDYVRKFYELELTGTTIRNLSLKAIRATPIALPPSVEQDDIARVLSALDENIKLLNSQLSQKLSLKKALMQDLLTGKVRVTID